MPKRFARTYDFATSKTSGRSCESKGYKLKYGDRMTKSGLSKIFACIAIALFMCLMLAKPEFYLNSARQGLALFASSVLPSLFPFYFCSLLLTFTGAVSVISSLGAKPVKLLYNAKKESAYAMFLSMLCGYPVGASTICELCNEGIFTKKDAKCACSFCSTSGPIFIVGTIGGAIFGNQKVGIILLFSHYFGAIFNGFLYRKRKENDEIRTFSTTKTVDNIMSNAIAKSTMNMLYVGGYIVICGMLADTLELVGLRDFLQSLGGVGQPILSVVYSLLEMTRGCLECAKCQSLRLAVVLCAGAVSFGGLSITLQNYNFLSKCGVGFFELILKKITQCAISMLFAYLFAFGL